MMIVFIIIALVVVLALTFLLSRRGAGPNSEVIKVTYEPHSLKTGLLDDEVMEIMIAGLTHNCTKKDIGPFSGVIFNEKDNPVDKKAMAIGDHRKKKIIGYVPNAILTDYRKWCKREERPCVGYIFWDGEHLRGRCRVYPTREDSDMEKYNEDGNKYIMKAAEHFGWDLNEDGSINP